MTLVKSILRWIAVPFVIAVVLATCTWLAIYAVSIADQSCTSMVAGTCVESWHSDAVEWAIYIAVILALVTIPTLSAWIAPAFKKHTALVMGLLGGAPLLIGYFMTNWDDLLFPSLLAIGAAAFGIFLVWRRQTTNAATETSTA